MTASNSKTTQPEFDRKIEDALPHIRRLVLFATLDWQAREGKPMPTLGANRRQRDSLERFRAALWISALDSGATLRDADLAVLSGIWFAAVMIDQKEMNMEGEFLNS